MKIKLLHLAGVVLLLALAVSVSFAGGYQINEHGARAVGMGGAFVARASDGSAMFFNPAGLGFQKGINLMLGTTLIMPSTTFTGPTPSTTETSMNSQTFYPSNFYASYSVGDKWVFGLGFFSPYGLGTEWPSNWVGSQLAVKTDLQTFYINPTVAYQVNDKLAFGAGLSVVLGTAKLSYNVPTVTSLLTFAPSLGTATLDGNGNGVSFDVGVLYKATEQLSVGASYRSLVKVDLKGTASFANMQALQTFFPGGDGSVTLPMPSNFLLGASYVISPKFTVEADFQWVGWKSYDQLQVTLANGPATPAGPPFFGQPLQKSPAAQVKNWDDGYLIRIGGEYTLNDKLTLRAGYINDVSPQPPSKSEPMLPDGDRNDFSIGGSYKINDKLNVDLAYMLVLFNERDAKTAAFQGTYKSSANLISVEFGYTF